MNTFLKIPSLNLITWKVRLSSFKNIKECLTVIFCNCILDHTTIIYFDSLDNANIIDINRSALMELLEHEYMWLVCSGTDMTHKFNTPPFARYMCVKSPIKEVKQQGWHIWEGWEVGGEQFIKYISKTKWFVWNSLRFIRGFSYHSQNRDVNRNIL